MRSPCWELHSSVGTKSVSAMQRMREGMARKKKKYEAGFEGGGVRGVALVGAYSVLEENGFQPVNLAGTSAGAIVAALIAAGYRAADLHRMLMELDLKEFQDCSLLGGLRVAGPLISLL